MYIIFLILINAIATILTGTRFIVDYVENNMTSVSWLCCILFFINLLMLTINVWRWKNDWY